MRLARAIMVYWLGHDLDRIGEVCGSWRIGHILERIKWETLAKILWLIRTANGYTQDEEKEFIRRVME